MADVGAPVLCAKARRDGDVFADADVRKCLCSANPHIVCANLFPQRRVACSFSVSLTFDWEQNCDRFPAIISSGKLFKVSLLETHQKLCSTVRLRKPEF